jgi:RNA polymerase sigma-70 factor, ECF subfamily
MRSLVRSFERKSPTGDAAPEPLDAVIITAAPEPDEPGLEEPEPDEILDPIVDAPPPPGGEDVLEHVTALRRYALLLVGEAADADDLVQECLLRVIGQSRAWRPVRDMRAYMFATLHNVFVDGHRRRRSRQTEIPIETVVADLVSPPSQTKWLEVRDMVAALAQLPAEQREVVLLVGLEGMSYMDAAKVLNVPIGTVMSRLSRGREALRRLTTYGFAGRLRIVK